MKKQNNNIEELFKSKLQNLEVDPGANAWAKVQSGISSGAASGAAAATSGSWASTTLVGALITMFAIGGFYFFKNEGEKKIQPLQTDIEEAATVDGVDQATNETKTISTNSVTRDKNSEDNVEKSSEKSETLTQAKKEAVESDKSISEEDKKTSSNERLADVSTEIEEKSIDQILAEHQQFLDEQASANSANTSDVSKTENTEVENSSSSQQGITQKVETEENGSTNSSSTQLTEEAKFKAEQKRIADQVVFPNVFSPDLDGKNDVFKMTVEKSISIDNIQVSIIDLNGKVVGGFTGIYNGWDGRLLNGSLAPVGWYKYQAIIYLDGNQIPKIGSFNLQ